MKFNSLVIPHILEAEGFTALQILMLKNNSARKAFFDYKVSPPNFKGDTWKAVFLAEVD